MISNEYCSHASTDGDERKCKCCEECPYCLEKIKLEIYDAHIKCCEAMSYD